MRHAWLIVLMLAAPAWAATFIVATTGSDANPCTLEQPCATYAHVRPLLASGDTLYFRQGSYVENIQITKESLVASGTSWGSATTIAGYPGETVTLTGGQGIQATIYDSALLQYVVFQNFHITNDGVLQAQGCGYRADGSVDMGCGPHFVRFQDIEVSGFGCHFGVANSYGASDLQYLNVTVHDGGCDRLDHGFYVLAPRSLYDQVAVYNVSGYCFQLYDSACPVSDGVAERNCGSDTVIRNSTFHDCRGDGAVTLNHGDGIQFYNNSVTNSHGGVGVSYGQPDGTTIHDNTIANNTGSAIEIGAGPMRTHVYNNTLSNNGADVTDRGTGTTSEPGLPPSDPPSGPSGPGTSPRLPPRTIPNPALAAAGL
jgi:parallel beta-helix repeat protein